MRIGINAGFGEIIGHDELMRLARLDFEIVRQDYIAGGRELLAEFLHTSLQPLFLIPGGFTELDPADVAALADECAAYCAELGLFGRDNYPMFEIVNEPSITPRYGRDPAAYARAVNSAMVMIYKHCPSAVVIAGGVHNTNRDGLRYLRNAVSMLDKSVWLGFHSYHTGRDPMRAHKGYASRHSELTVVNALAGIRPVVCTEIGRHNGPQGVPSRILPCIKRRYVETPERSAEYLAREMRLLASHGVVFAIVYQHRDGPNRNYDQDNYGILYEDGSEKPAAQIAQIWAVEP